MSSGPAPGPALPISVSPILDPMKTRCRPEKTERPPGHRIEPAAGGARRFAPTLSRSTTRAGSLRSTSSLLGALVLAAVAAGARAETTIYVNRHFEVRDHDAPVKYIFHGATRIARITGSITAGSRIQRLRLQPGWNLVSLAVTAPNLPAQLQASSTKPDEPLVPAAYRWQPAARRYAELQPGETVAGGTVLWLQACTNRVVALRGNDAPPANPSIPPGGGFVAPPGLETWRLSRPDGASVWKYAAAERRWQTGFAGDLASLNDLPPELGPGEAVFVHTAEQVEFPIPDPSLRIAYYHPDHLGSVSVITDSTGRVAEETAYQPFGTPRSAQRPREADGHYGFTQKEQDPESRLHYFEARHLASPLARFLSFDPKVKHLETLASAEFKDLLAQPAKLNPFAYTLNNPVRYTDPDGRDARPRPADVRPPLPEPEIRIRIGRPSKQPGELAALSFSFGHQPQPTPALAGGRKDGTRPRELQIMRHTDKASMELFRKSQTGQPIKSLTLILPHKDGKEFQIHLSDVLIESFAVSGHAGDATPVESFTLNAAAMRFTAPEPPTREPPRGEQRTHDPRRVP